MKFSFRLERYRKWIAEQKADLERSLRICRAEREESLKRLRQCEVDYTRLVNDLRRHVGQGVSPHQVRIFQMFIDQADKMVRKEKGVVDQIEQRIEALLVRWRSCHQQEEVLDRLYQRRLQEHLLETARQEQRQFDDWATLKGGGRRWTTS